MNQILNEQVQAKSGYQIRLNIFSLSFQAYLTYLFRCYNLDLSVRILFNREKRTLEFLVDHIVVEVQQFLRKY